MFRLGSFGGLILTDAAGEVVMPQRRRLALLALLAAAASASLSRDKVLGYLWSELLENARHAWNNCSIRCGSGRPTLFQGTDPLRLDTRVVHAMSSSSRRAMAANDPSSAVGGIAAPSWTASISPARRFESIWVEAGALGWRPSTAGRRSLRRGALLGRQTAEIDLRRRHLRRPTGRARGHRLVQALVEAGTGLARYGRRGGASQGSSGPRAGDRPHGAGAAHGR